MKIYNSALPAFAAMISLVLSSCEKEAGEGGTSKITGKVYQIQYDASFQTAVDTVPANDEDVYIIYGNEGSTYDDDFKTSFDGSFKFEFLQKGTYRLFAYSDDSTGAYNGNLNPESRDVPVIVEVSVSNNGGEAISPTIYILKNNQ
ncbi:MAG: hypothetical protein ACO1G9_15140 [Bacteroidota bacterium]